MEGHQFRCRSCESMFWVCRPCAGREPALLRVGVPRLLDELRLARGDGSLNRLFAKLARTHVLVLDDWGVAPLGDQDRRDILEVIEERHGLRSTVIATQLPVASWHKVIGDPTIADAILDRLVHNAHRIELTGKSMRTRSSRKKEASSRK